VKLEDISKILVVTKKTRLDYYLESYGTKAEKILKSKKIDYGSYIREQENHYSTLKTVEDVIKTHSINYEVALKDRLEENNFRDISLVISVGGDGTFIDASHFINDGTPLLGVNSNPPPNGDFDVSYSIGHYLSTKKEDFAEKFRMLLKGDYKICNQRRIQAKLSTATGIPLAINEVYLGKYCAMDASRYEMYVDDFKEQQTSSGIIVCSTDGWSGWIGNFRDAPIYDYSTRNLLCYYAIAPNKKAKFIRGFAEKVKIRSFMYNGIITIDGSRDRWKYDFLDGYEAVIEMSGRGLRLVRFE